MRAMYLGIKIILEGLVFGIVCGIIAAIVGLFLFFPDMLARHFLDKQYYHLYFIHLIVIVYYIGKLAQDYEVRSKGDKNE